MLKGLVIAVSEAQLLEKELNRQQFPWVEIPKTDGKVFRDRDDFRRATEQLAAQKEELLCLVETDQEEQTARSMGLICIGYIDPEQERGQRLSGCRVLLEGLEEIDLQFLQNVHTRALGLPVTVAETQRLLIREMTIADLDDIHTLYQEGEFTGFQSHDQISRQEEEERIKAYITYMYGLYQFGMWVVIEKESGLLIGRVGFGIADYLDFSEIDMGYLIKKEHRCRGYAEEASRAVLDYAVRVLEFQEVSAYVEQKNLISIHLLEKLGFRRMKAFTREGKELYRYLCSLS